MVLGMEIVKRLEILLIVAVPVMNYPPINLKTSMSSSEVNFS